LGLLAALRLLITEPTATIQMTNQTIIPRAVILIVKFVPCVAMRQAKSRPEKSNGNASGGLLKWRSDEVVFICPACLSHPLDGRSVETAHY
jgi:hypothetical protein